MYNHETVAAAANDGGLRPSLLPSP